MCVKLILPPRVRRSWLLMTTRLSASSFAGTARTLVAVGTVSEAFMFLTTSDAAPRRVVATPSACSGVFSAGRAAHRLSAGLLDGGERGGGGRGVGGGLRGVARGGGRVSGAVVGEELVP